MKPTRLSQVNKALNEAGIDAELVAGSGYFYFSGPAMDLVFENGVYGVCRLKELTIEQWVQEAKQKIEEASK